MENNVDRNNNQLDTDFDYLTPENVEAELQRLKIIEDDYYSDDEQRDKVRLTNKGIDLKALRAGQDIEFEYDTNQEDNYDFEDEKDEKIDYEKIYKYRNLEMIVGELDQDEGDEESEEKSSKTPFEILKMKMVDISPNKDEGVLKRTIIPGSGLVIPDGSRVRIHYNAYFEMNDEPFDSTYLRNKSFEFKLGAGEVVYGLDIAVATMKKMEKAQFIFDPKYYIGEVGCEPRIPRQTPVLFEIEVISFIEASVYDKYEATPEEQRSKLTLTQMLQICSCLRELGNDNFSRKNYKEASKKYRKAIYLLENISVPGNEEEEKKWKGVMLKLYLNMSVVCLKQTKPKKTIFYCKLALDLDPDNVKAIFRYGCALRLLQDFERARRFLVKANKLSPTDKSIHEEITKLNEMVAKYNMLEKACYKRMFNNADNDTELVLKEKNVLSHEVEKSIIEQLNKFMANEKIKVYKVPFNRYSLDIINYIISQAEEKKLNIRTINEGEKILQLLKND